MKRRNEQMAKGIYLIKHTGLTLMTSFLAANLKRTQLRNELNEVEGHQDSTNSENVALKRDKLLLADEVANLNAKVLATKQVNAWIMYPRWSIDSYPPGCHTSAKAAEIFLGDLNSVTFSISLPTGMSPFTCGCVPFLSRVCHFSLAGMSPFTREYATFHTRVCHLSSVGIPLFTRGHVTFYSWECHFSLLGLSPFTCGFFTFHSRVWYLPLAAMSSFARGFATTHLWACHLSTVQPRICPNIPVISSFAISIHSCVS